MESSHETPVTEQRVDRTLSTEKVSSGESTPIRDETHRASDATFSPDIAPAYKNDKAYNHEIDLERGERLPGETKLADASSMESPGKIGATDEIGEDEEYPPSWLTRTWRKYRPFGHAIIWLLVTAYFPDEANSNNRWWICGLVLHRDEWLIPFLLWLAITLWMIFQYIPTTVVSKPLFWGWRKTFVRLGNMVPEKLQIPASALFVISVILAGTFASPTTADNNYKNRGISIAGLAIFYGCLWLTSANRKRIVWRTVLVGLLFQYILALFVLRTQAGYDIFNFISFLARELLSFANAGTAFLTAQTVLSVGWFLISVIPAIIFFISIVQLLYYYGILQWVVVKFAKFFFWAMKVSGAEAVCAAASPFVGQGESAVLIKPFIPYLTKAECHQIMCSGFATIAGSVLVAYISFGINPQALISSCVMSIPASLAVSKMRMPETEQPITEGRVVIPESDEPKKVNALHAFSDGAWVGLLVAGMIVTNLLVIIALVALIDALLGWIGSFFQVPQLSIVFVLGYVLYPIAALLGVPSNDIYLVAQLIGTKIVQNEFVAYTALSSDPQYTSMSPRSQLIATYALCGFGNIGSLGIQIGVLGQLGPKKKKVFAQVALSALLTGVLATLMSASIAGMVLMDESGVAPTSSSSS